MDFFGVEISDERFEAAMVEARRSWHNESARNLAIAWALGFNPRDDMLAAIKSKAASELRGSGG